MTIIISFMIRLRVPATSANLGPGFDCLGLALDLWNEVTFEEEGQPGFFVKGEGAEILNSQPDNLLTHAVDAVYAECGSKKRRLRITSDNKIPLSSGLGSSAAAILAGLSGANELLGRPLGMQALLDLGTRLEGHPDNLAPALLGGLVVSIQGEKGILTQQYPLPEWTAVVIQPAVDLPTRMARAVLPASVPRADVVFNLGRVPLVVEALRRGDLELLRKVMDDRLHQSYRLAHIPTGEAAIKIARSFGAAALSGAGPSLITFVEPGQAQKAQSAISAVFGAAGLQPRGFILRTSNLGIQIN